MSDYELKSPLHDELRWAREAMVWKLDGLSDYDVRRPLTKTGTNLLGLVKHLAMGESRYLGEVFGRPFAPRLPWWDEGSEPNADQWAFPAETRADILDLYRRVCGHSDATIEALALDAPGLVPWWPRPEVRLVNVIAHVLAETSRHAGHADILRAARRCDRGRAGICRPARPGLGVVGSPRRQTRVGCPFSELVTPLARWPAAGRSGHSAVAGFGPSAAPGRFVRASNGGDVGRS